MISIIIPNFNKASFITETLDSLLAQTFSDWEAIIIDDCSTDNSLTIINGYLIKDTRFHLIKNSTNSGGSYSRNRGLDAAKGEYLIFLDSDDILTPNCLELRYSSIFDTAYNLVVFPMGTFYKEFGDSLSQWRPKPNEDHLKKILAHDIPWSIMQGIWRKSMLIKLEGFDENYPRLQDVELHTRALLDKYLNYHIDNSGAPDCFYRIDERRLNFNQDDFMLRCYRGIELYITKFSTLLDKKHLKFLRGTYFSFINQLLNKKITQQINRDTYENIYNKLSTVSLPHLKLSALAKLHLNLYCRIYLCGAYKIKGFNFIFKKIFQRL
jgi:glycosyltransferase involved in cell wall biosynthesis